MAVLIGRGTSTVEARKMLDVSEPFDRWVLLLEFVKIVEGLSMLEMIDCVWCETIPSLEICLGTDDGMAAADRDAILL